MINIKTAFTKFLRLVSPATPVGGLEISDNFLRFFGVVAGVPKTAAIHLPPGVVTGGRVAEPVNFRKALHELRANVAGGEARCHVVVTLETPAVYSQIFSVPVVAPDRLGEAVELNLRMISPMSVDRVYADAERVGSGASGETEYLGAFLERAIADEFSAALASSGFVLLALEFTGLSVARLIGTLGVGYVKGESYLVLRVSAGGLELLILRNGNLHFDHFSPWGEVGADGARAIDDARFEDVLRREVQRVLNFYSGKWPGSFKGVILLARDVAPRVERVLTQYFDLAVMPLAVTQFGDVIPSFAGALGAYLRGSISRESDTFISVAPVGTEEAFAWSRLLRFLAFWRNVALTACSFLFLVTLVAASISARIETSLRTTSTLVPPGVDANEVAMLESQAKAFNSDLGAALRARGSAKVLSPLFTELRKISGETVTLERVSFSPSGGEMNISGRAISELAAINFKNALARREGFTAVNLPLANIVPDSDGKVTFQLTLRVEKEAP
ncbi:MAG: PilN domain-containing protein [bacterium]|nr:PilN domain-containing protein [bacterium]